MADPLLLGNEAAALGAIHAGAGAAYSYPGTPSTEAFEYIERWAAGGGGRLHAAWCANEKSAYEQALGASLVGARAFVSMKHVGLNVAADPFVCSGLIPLHAGLVVMVADDPGMHSSQNEQDSRFYADFAMIPCLEPATPQEAYEMTRAAFDLSERLAVPVMVRLVTRLAHSRGAVRTSPPAGPRPLRKAPDPTGWILMPMYARRLWRRRLDGRAAMEAALDAAPFREMRPGADGSRTGVITAGLAGEHYREIEAELGTRPPHLHLSAYPPPSDGIRKIGAASEILYVFEEGAPRVERRVRALCGNPALEVRGRDTGHVPPDGELDPDALRRALGLAPAAGRPPAGIPVPARPPRLCSGCPHADAYAALNAALQGMDLRESLVTSDIGCYTLGALPPHSAIETCVCMGASVGMAKGAADAGFRPAVAVIGDSTFLHSGMPALLEAARAGTDMTLIILDNGTVAMTGGQPTALPSSRLRDVVAGLGVDPGRVMTLAAHRREHAENARRLRGEILRPGLSVVLFVRDCLEKRGSPPAGKASP